MGTQQVNLPEQVNDQSGGWIPVSVPITFISADSPSYLVSINYNVTGTFGLGMKMQLTHQNSIKNFFITQVTLTGTNTYLNLYGGTDYTLTSAAITNPFYSHAKAPLGFPLNPSKWTVEYRGTTTAAQASPVQNTWYNVGSRSITVPIGVWRVHYQNSIYGSAYPTTTGNVNCYCTLSTSNNSESDVDWTVNVQAYDVAYIYGPVFRENLVELTSKTTLYMNLRTVVTGLVSIGDDATRSPAIIRAVCAYL